MRKFVIIIFVLLIILTGGFTFELGPQIGTTYNPPLWLELILVSLAMMFLAILIISLFALLFYYLKLFKFWYKNFQESLERH